MNKQLLIAAAVLSLVQATEARAQGGVQVFGIVDTYLDVSRGGEAKAERVQSGGISGSRLGFRGSEDLGSGMKAVFLIESGINVDDGSLGQGGLAFGRQAWAGLSTRAGDLTFGRQYSPNFFTIVTYGLGGGLAWGNASNYFTDVSPLRVNNSVSYVSPTFKGVKARLLYGAGENTTQPGGHHVGDSSSGSLQYDNGRFSAGFAVQTRKTTTANTERFFAGGASYQFDVAKVALLAQGRRDDVHLTENDALEIGVQIPLGPGFLLLDVGHTRHRNLQEADATAFSVRYDYNLSKRTMLYAGAAHIRNQGQARFGINGNTGQALVMAPGADPRSVVVGMRHSF